MPINQAKALIDEYLRRLAECSVCDGSGRFSFPLGMELDHLLDRSGNEIRNPYVRAGTPGTCPGCGGKQHDPEFFAWHCFNESKLDRCDNNRDQVTALREEHATCGYRLMILLDDAPQ